MKCREINNKLSLYLDDLLDPEESAEIREHLNVCDSCSRELRELQQLKSALQSIKPVQAPDSLLRSINERIDKENTVSAFQYGLKKIVDLLTMRHAVEAAGLFAATAVIVIIFLPSVKNSVPLIETAKEKIPAAHQKRSGKKLLKAEKSPAPAPMDKMKEMTKTARLKDSPGGANKISPVILSFALKERVRDNVALKQNTADEAFENIRSERKTSKSAPSRSSKKSKLYTAKEYAPGSGKLSKSDSYKSAPSPLSEELEERDTVSTIKEIAGRFEAVVKKLENTKKIEVTIQSQKLEAFLNELKKTGSVRIIQKNLNESSGLIQIQINYE